MGEIFRETRVTSRNMITDWVQGIRNMLGLRLKSYEDAINFQQQELQDKYLTGKEVKWFRFDVEHSGNGSFIIGLYGEYK